MALTATARQPAERTLGAPGVVFSRPAAVRTVTGVRRDVAAFAGVAPRGPARVPAWPVQADTDVAALLTAAPVRRSVAVAVDSWAEYRQLYGGFEGPGRLPYAVSAFFAGGGRRAYVIRVVHDHGDAVADAAGRASGTLAPLATSGGAPIRVRARDEGAWGNRLRARLTLTARPLATLAASPIELHLPYDEDLPVGSLLRARSADGSGTVVFASAVTVERDPTRARRFLRARFEAPLDAVPAQVEVVLARLSVTDHDRAFARTERHDGCGLHADHPRWLARVLAAESDLLAPDAGWAAADVRVTDPMLPPVEVSGEAGASHLQGGVDRYATIAGEDFFDRGWVLGDEAPGDGVHCLAEHGDVGLLLAPDLYSPAPLVSPDDVRDPPTTAGPLFGPCPGPVLAPPEPVEEPPGLDGLRLDPAVPAELAEVIRRQSRLVGFAEAHGDLTALLDVPPGLTTRRILEWRGAFDSPHAAAYHPWLDVAAPDDGRDALVRVNPSAFAAGIIAEREIRSGIHTGPANQVAQGAVRVAATVAPERHDALHPAGINVFLPERDGIRLAGARTLSRRAPLRQLSVARLVSVLRLSLEREMAPYVFEPNNETLWRDLRRAVEGFLRRLHDAGAFAGARPSESYFVRCDRTTMTRNDVDQGRLVCLIGVAPVEPVEYVVLRLEQQGDASVRVEVTGD